MEEHEYRATYQALSQRHCVFEKAINSRRCSCKQSARFHLADREGVACGSDAGNILCIALLDALRRNARFSLHITHADGPLPHAKEIRVQIGGLLGLQKLLHPDQAQADSVNDINGLATEAIDRYGRIENLPYELIVQTLASFEGRRKRTRPLK
ncbi:MAG: hypothetical protein WCH04_03495 [Gammaproteobacteria bacterium]